MSATVDTRKTVHSRKAVRWSDISRTKSKELFIQQLPDVEQYPLPDISLKFGEKPARKGKISSKLAISLGLHVAIVVFIALGLKFTRTQPPATEIEVIFDNSVLPGAVTGEETDSAPQVQVESQPPPSEAAAEPNTAVPDQPKFSDPSDIQAMEKTPEQVKAEDTKKPEEKKTDQIKVLDENYTPDNQDTDQAIQNSIASMAAGARAISAKKIVSPAWQRSLGIWLQEHRKYPQAAIDHKEQGTAIVEFRVNKQGYVSNVKLVRGTGYPLLDEAVMKMLQGAKVPAFPPEMTQEQVSVPIQIQYLLDE